MSIIRVASNPSDPAHAGITPHRPCRPQPPHGLNMTDFGRMVLGNDCKRPTLVVELQLIHDMIVLGRTEKTAFRSSVVSFVDPFGAFPGHGIDGIA